MASVINSGKLLSVSDLEHALEKISYSLQWKSVPYPTAKRSPKFRLCMLIFIVKLWSNIIALKDTGDYGDLNCVLQSLP